MNFELSDTTAMILDALDALLSRHKEISHQDALKYYVYSPELASELEQGQFLEIAREDGGSLLDAALVVERLARAPWCVEAGNSAIVATGLGLRDLNTPVAVVSGLRQPARFLPLARHVIVELADGVLVAPVRPNQVAPLTNVLAAPMGMLAELPEGQKLPVSALENLRRLRRVALACEAAGAMRAALDVTIAYVRDRNVFGKPLATYQAVEHRLAIGHQQVASTFNLAMLAAYSGSSRDAATAAAYAQQVVRNVLNDCHQFSGAIGLTLEYPLHLWTYRLKIIQGELGGVGTQIQTLADILWPDPDRQAA